MLGANHWNRGKTPQSTETTRYPKAQNGFTSNIPTLLNGTTWTTLLHSWRGTSWRQNRSKVCRKMKRLAVLCSMAAHCWIPPVLTCCFLTLEVQVWPHTTRSQKICRQKRRKAPTTVGISYALLLCFIRAQCLLAKLTTTKGCHRQVTSAALLCMNHVLPHSNVAWNAFVARFPFIHSNSGAHRWRLCNLTHFSPQWSAQWWCPCYNTECTTVSSGTGLERTGLTQFLGLSSLCCYFLCNAQQPQYMLQCTFQSCRKSKEN